jgi:hypothetical protein
MLNTWTDFEGLSPYVSCTNQNLSNVITTSLEIFNKDSYKVNCMKKNVILLSASKWKYSQPWILKLLNTWLIKEVICLNPILIELHCDTVIKIFTCLIDNLKNGRFHQHLRDTFAPLVVRYVDLMESSIAQSIHKGFEKERWEIKG